MHVNISLQSGPIYEQLKYQIRAQIYSGELRAGEMLPSIRMLAKELKIGIITAKRAYDDLIEEGLLYAVQGKGVFVASKIDEELESKKEDSLKEMLEKAKLFARENGISKDRFQQIMREISEEDDEQS